MPLPQFIDLHALAETLSSDPKFKRLKPVIKDAVLRQSCVSDLSQAETALETLTAITRTDQKSSLESRAVEHALLTHVILLYCRATAGNGKRGERGSVNIRHHYSSQLCTDHDVIVDVRNRAIAHVYTGKSVDDHIWHEGLLFLLQTDDGLLPCGTTRSTQLNANVLQKLSRLLPPAIDLMRAKFIESTNRLVEILNQNGVMDTVINEHSFDPVAFFGSLDVVEQVIAGRVNGRTAI